MNISATYTNIHGNKCIESIENVQMKDGWAKVTVRIVEFDGLVTIEDHFVAKIPVLVIPV